MLAVSQNSFDRKDTGMQNLDFFRRQLLENMKAAGVRVSHRNEFFWFDEKDARLLLDKATDQSGFCVGDRVMVNGNWISPWLPSTSHNSEAWEDSAKFSNRVFRILAFFKIEGKVAKTPVEGTFCALVACGIAGLEEPAICRGQELGRELGKVNLYWVGCLEKPDFLAQDQDLSLA